MPADYIYSIANNRLSITDLDLGNISVTNDIERVLTEINHIEGNRAELVNDIIYCDTEGDWNTVIPTWFNHKCTEAGFRYGVTEADIYIDEEMGDDVIDALRYTMYSMMNKVKIKKDK